MRKHLLVLAVALLPICGIVSEVSAATAPLRGTEPRLFVRGSVIPSLKYVGVVDDAVKDPQYPTALYMMELVKDAGFNSVRITVNWWNYRESTKLSDYDRMGLCNAARAAEELGIKLVVTIMVDHGNPPVNQEHYERIVPYLRDVVDVWLGKNPVQREEGAICATTTKNLAIEVGNEPNLETFLKPQWKNGRRESAWIYANLLARAYPTLKQQGTLHGVNVEVWGLALGSSKDPVNFLRAMAAAMEGHKIKGPLMDVCTWHPYSSNSDIGPSSSGRGFGSYTNILKSVRKIFGKCRIVYSEVGWETAPPPGKEVLYEQQDPGNVRLITEQRLAEFIISGFHRTAKQGVDGLFIFKLFDEKYRSQGWQSGLYYPSNTGIYPKATLELVRPTLMRLSGR